MEYSQSNKRSGWFSNRYQTAAAHLSAKEVKIAKETAWIQGIAKRAEDRRERTPQQQIAVLDKRLGEGIGAKRERKRLARQIANAIPNKKEETTSDKSKRRGERKRRGKSNSKDRRG